MMTERPQNQWDATVDPDAQIFVISVAAELAGMHAQTLRNYDRLGLVTPHRTTGGGRRYSPRDVALLREVQRLSQDEGVNLAGIKRIIELTTRSRLCSIASANWPRRSRKSMRAIAGISCRFRATTRWWSGSPATSDSRTFTQTAPRPVGFISSNPPAWSRFGVSTQREEICRRRLNVHSVRFHDSTFQRLTLSRSHSMLHPKQLLARSSSGCLVGWCSKSGTSTGRSFFRQVFA